jgi:hypothetical protein
MKLIQDCSCYEKKGSVPREDHPRARTCDATRVSASLHALEGCLVLVFVEEEGYHGMDDGPLLLLWRSETRSGFERCAWPCGRLPIVMPAWSGKPSVNFCPASVFGMKVLRQSVDSIVEEIIRKTQSRYMQ